MTPEKNKGDSNSSEANNNNNRTSHSGLWWILAIGGILLATLLFVSIFLPNLTERVKFFTVNALSALVLAAIAVQAYIYRRQWEVMKTQAGVLERQAGTLESQVTAMGKQVAAMEGQLVAMKDQAQSMRDGLVETRNIVRQNERAVEIAEKSAAAAEESAQAAKNSLFYSQRAFVFLKVFTVMFHLNPDDRKIRAIRIYAEWENTGTTPALNCENRLAVKLVEGKVEGSIEIPPDDGEFEFEKFNVGQRSVVTGGDKVILLTDLEKVWKKQARMFVWAIIKYSDIFPETKQHTTINGTELIFNEDLSGRSFPDGPMPSGFAEFRSFGNKGYAD